MVVAGVNSYPTTVPPETVILGNSWIRIGDVLNFISGAGGGKSVAANQAMIAWALGLPYMGIRPPRPLRILLFSGEDDGVTIGQCREGFLEHSKAITGRQLSSADLDRLDSMVRTEFCREHVGLRFHSHLSALLRESPADLVIINPLLSYIGGEIVACASEWLRAGLMPILQDHKCAALVIHHTPKLAKDSWSNIDDTYSGIGGGEVANVPRSILTLKPTPADGLFVVTVSKRQTTGWKDDEGNFSPCYFVKRSGDPERPAWIPVSHEEAGEMIADGKATVGSAKASKKATPDHVVEALRVGPTQRRALIERVMKHCQCSDRTASEAILRAESEGLISSFAETNPRGGNPIKWLRLPEHSNQ
jgi:AAA domain